MKFLLLPLLLLVPLTNAGADEFSWSDWAYDYFIDGATLKPGIGTRQAGIRVVRLSDEAEGKIVQRNEESYFLQYSTSPIWFSIENTGLTFMFNLSGFDADQQEVGRDIFLDLGSRANGRFFYVVPTVFYEWGNYLSGKYVRLGLGLGAGIASFDGEVILTSTPTNEVVSVDRRSRDITAATSVMLEAHWYHWGLTIQAASPVYETDEYQISVEDISINLGYQFVF